MLSVCISDVNIMHPLPSLAAAAWYLQWCALQLHCAYVLLRIILSYYFSTQYYCWLEPINPGVHEPFIAKRYS